MRYGWPLPKHRTYWSEEEHAQLAELVAAGHSALRNCEDPWPLSGERCGARLEDRFETVH